MRLGAIDIGSNAVRLLVADVGYKSEETSELYIKKIKLYRVPVRLGLEAFTEKYISEALLTKLIKTMQAFRLIMDVYEVEDYRCCATSALREAQNGKEVMAAVKKKSNIEIRLIDGQEEAKLILSNKLSNLLDKRFAHLYVDVGGGSTEISLLKGEALGLSKSFKIGTIRLFKQKVKAETWTALQKWLEQEIQPQMPLAIIGSGGNINRVFKRSNNRYGHPLQYDYLLQERELLNKLSLEDRIMLQDLNRDRAEVIVPALDIFLFIMKQTGIKQVIVPKIGLADGVVRQLFREKMEKSLLA
jgi:exopolyphosphatase/guanosine-5'-triphosphate,3'-diphosphate pyrophosphatase